MARGGARTPPKDAAQRRRYNQPARGEWVDLEPLEAPVLEAADPEWSPAAQRLWNALRRDPISTQYDEVDIQAVKEFMRFYDELKPGEQRLRMDGFGMTPKGKRDLRWRTPNEVKTIKNAEAKAQVRRLRTVPTQKETG